MRFIRMFTFWNVTITLIALACSLMASVLAYQNSTLKREVARLITSTYRDTEVPVGTRVPPMEGFSRSGTLIQALSSPHAPPTLLFIFSATCPFCEDNWPSWDRLKSVAQTLQVEPLFVSLSPRAPRSIDAAHSLDDHHLILSIQPKDVVAYKLMHTPQTIVVSGGIVRGVWSGTLDGDDVAGVIHALRSAAAIAATHTSSTTVVTIPRSER